MYKRLFILVAVGVLLLAASSPVYARPAAWTTIGRHVVKPGETLFCIARAYRVSPWSIAAHNGIVNPNLIHSGLVLAIPNAYTSTPAGPTCAAQFPPAPVPPPPACTCVTSHMVVSGENLSRISLRYGVDMWRIAQCNGILNLNYIKIGQVLCIPGS
jgi:LysM repeat protein